MMYPTILPQDFLRYDNMETQCQVHAYEVLQPRKTRKLSVTRHSGAVQPFSSLFQRHCPFPGVDCVNCSVIVLVSSSLFWYRNRVDSWSGKYVIDDFLCSLNFFLNAWSWKSTVFYSKPVNIYTLVWCFLSKIPSQWKTKDHILLELYIHYYTDSNPEKYI